MAKEHGYVANGLRCAASEMPFLERSVRKKTNPFTVWRKERGLGALGTRNRRHFELRELSTPKANDAVAPCHVDERRRIG